MKTESIVVQAPVDRAEERLRHYIRPREVRCPKARLIAYPYAGAGAVAYHQWAKHLPADIELISIQYPGRGRLMDMEPLTSIDELVAEAYETVLTISDKPFYFFGHSLGALVAFETVRKLRRFEKTLPKALFVSSHKAPQTRSLSDYDLHTLPDERLLAGLMRYGGMPAEILQSPDMLAYVMPLIRADMTALETWCYQPEPALNIPITVLGGDKDKTVHSTQLQCWRDLTNSDFQCHIMPGNHFYIQDQLPAVIDKLCSVIEETNVN
jgi:medium-chain acyl-[acyl-carrier-protein] hydrolase